MMPSQNTFTDVLSRAEAAQYLRVCKTTLDRLAIPRVQIRRWVLFKKSTLDAWLDQQTVVKGART
jgi:excisionase family DNA binding protein